MLIRNVNYICPNCQIIFVTNAKSYLSSASSNIGSNTSNKVDQGARLGKTKRATSASAIRGQFALDGACGKVNHQSTCAFLRRPFAALNRAFGELQWADRTFANALGQVNRSCNKISKQSTLLRRSFAALHRAFGELKRSDGAFANALGKVNRSCYEVSKKSALLVVRGCCSHERKKEDEDQGSHCYASEEIECRLPM